MVLAAAVRAQDEGPPPLLQQGVLVLRNGEVLRGDITFADDRFLVLTPGGEIRVRHTEAEFACRTLAEGYVRKRAALRAPRADDHLGLAEWCIRHGLFEYATQELAVAAVLDPRHPKLFHLKTRMEQALSRPVTPPPLSSATSAEGSPDLDRLVRAMPAGAVEKFTTDIQPLLLNSCGSSGCHGPRSQGDYHLLRLPANRLGTRRLTQRNLQATLQLIDREHPHKSPLLNVPLQPHGTSKTPLFRDGSTYRQLVRWVNDVSQATPTVVTAGTEETALGPYNVKAAQFLDNGDADSRETAQPDPTSSSPPAKIEASRIDGPRAPSGLSPVQRGAPPDYVPRDAFDPEIFNRRYPVAGE